MNVGDGFLMVAAAFGALWWAFARHRAPVALECLSFAGLGLGVLRVVRVFGRAALVLGILAGGLGLLARVPQLPRPSGSHLVGSVVFHWTDAQRPETFATSVGERRQVVAQAWYPTETPGRRCPTSRRRGDCPRSWTPTQPFSTATSTR